jgi:hypothetical protein
MIHRCQRARIKKLPRHDTLTVVLRASHPILRVNRRTERKKGQHAPWSNISPNGPAMPVRRACFLSQASHTPRHPHATPSHSRKGHTPIYRVESLIQEQPDGPSVARRVSTRSAFRPAAAGLNGRCESNARKVHPIWRARRAALLR